MRDFYPFLELGRRLVLENLDEGDGVGVRVLFSVLFVDCVVETIRLVMDDLKALEVYLDGGLHWVRIK